MAEVTADHERAADVPKVERQDAKSSEAAQAADKVVDATPKQVEKAHDRAEEIAEAEAAQDPSKAKVEVVLSEEYLDHVDQLNASDEKYERPDSVKVSVAGFKDVTLKAGESLEVSLAHANALKASPAVDVPDDIAEAAVTA